MTSSAIGSSYNLLDTPATEFRRTPPTLTPSDAEVMLDRRRRALKARHAQAVGGCRLRDIPIIPFITRSIGRGSIRSSL